MTSSQQPTQSIPRLPRSVPQAALEVVHGSQNGPTIACSRVVTLVGARSGCKVLLKHESVDPVHLAIVHDGSKIRAADLMSPRGSILNQLKLDQEVLHDGDRLGVSAWEFRVGITEPQSSAGDDEHVFALDPSPVAVALQHIESGQLLHPKRDICIIGRRQGCDIHISSRYVSRSHALLVSYMGHPAIVDLLSSHHTYVNGNPVMFQILQDQDIVGIGDAQFRVLAVGPSSVKPESGAHQKGDSVLPEDTAEVPPSEQQRPNPPIPLAAPDQIDIEHVEGSQRWRIADNYEKLTRQPK